LLSGQRAPFTPRAIACRIVALLRRRRVRRLQEASGKMRGQGSEPVELRPGVSAREAAQLAEIEQWAWRRVRALRGFYSHLTAYVIINFVLFMIDSTTPGPAWFYAPLIGWGLLVCLHGLHAYEMLPWTTQGWEERKVRELIDSRTRR
jgi:2TM domain